MLGTWSDQEIDALLKARKNTDGRVVLRRLNRVEYQNTMSDLLGIEADFSRNLPPEGLSKDGFRNNGSVLQMSDLQLEYYLAAARDGLRKAIVTGPEPEVFRYQSVKTVRDKNRGSNILDQDQQFIAKLMEYPEEGEIIIRAKARAKFAKGRGFPQLRAAIGYRADVQAPRGFMDPVDVTSEEWQTFEFRGRIAVVGPAQANAVLCGKGVAGDHHFHRLAHAQEPGVKVIVRNPEPHRGVSHFGVVGHVDEVATGREFAAPGEAIAVDLRDHRFAELPDAHPARGDVPGPVSVAAGGVPGKFLTLVAVSEFVARRKTRAGAAHDHHANARVPVCFFERVQDAAAHLVVEGVAFLRAIEGYATNRGCRIVYQYEIGAHGGSSFQS